MLQFYLLTFKINRCEAKAKMQEATIIIDQNKEQFEKERKQILEYQANQDNLKLYSQVYNIYKKAIEILEKTKQFELIAKIYYKLGQYTQSIDYFNQQKKILNQQPLINKQEKINEINNNIKSLYLYKADLFERSKNSQNQQQVQLFYEQFEQFLEKEQMRDQNILYIAFRLNNVQKLFQNLINFKQNNLIEKENLIKTLHYYYPHILEQELKKINEIPVNFKEKKDQKKILGQKLVELLQTLIIPFQEEFKIIARSRQNMEYFKSQIQFFEIISGIQEFPLLGREIINGQNLMMFYVMLIHFGCLDTQKVFNHIVQSISLAHTLYTNQLFNQQDNQKKILEVISEISKIDWLRSRKLTKYIEKDKKIFYIYLGYYDQLIKSQLIVIDSQFQFTLDLSLNKVISKISNSNDEQIIIQQIMNNQIEDENIKQYQNQRIYHNYEYYLTPNPIKFKEQFIETIKAISRWIKNGYIDDNSSHNQFTRCQDYLFYFYRCLMMKDDIPIFENNIIESISTIIEYIINFNYSLNFTDIIGENNQIFIDAFCSIFGFINPCKPNSSKTDFTNASNWNLIGYFDNYLICQNSQILSNPLINKEGLISPILNPIYSNLKIVNKKTAILICKQTLVNIKFDKLFYYYL